MSIVQVISTTIRPLLDSAIPISAEPAIPIWAIS